VLAASSLQSINEMGSHCCDVIWGDSGLFPRETLSDNTDPTKCSNYFPLSLRSETQKTLGNSERFEGGISVVDMRMS
jgi:hypothetical protein